jgi:hypothetical protein
MTLSAFGFPEAEWTAAKQQAKDIIVKRAKSRGMISYSELLSQVSAITLQPHDSRVTPFLEQISREECAAGRPLVTALVTHKTGDMQPGTGFYEVAESLGRDTSDREKCWIEEVARVHAYWA